MAEALPETIDKATAAIQVAARPNVFVVIVALVAITGVALLVYRDEIRADAQIRVLETMSQRLSDLDGDFRASGIRVGATAQRRTAQPAVERE